MNSFISIVLPIFQPKSSYLIELFASIEQQTFLDYEVIISDDADDELMIKELLPVSIAERVRYLKNNHKKGIFGNLNNALRNAHADYIQIFCQDDIMTPSLLQNNLLELEENQEAGMVFTMSYFIRGEDYFGDFDYSFIRYIPKLLSPPDTLNYLLYFGCLPGNLSTVMLRSSVLQSIGYFNESYQFAGDYEYWARLGRKHAIVFSKHKLVHVRNHMESASRTLGTFIRYSDVSQIYKYLLIHNTIPFEHRILQRYLHQFVFRSIVSYTLRKNVRMERSDWQMIRDLFDGNPFSLRMAISSFFVRKNRDIQKLKAHMNVDHI